MIAILAACPNENAGEGDDTDGAETATDGICDPIAPLEGMWDPQMLDWSDVDDEGVDVFNNPGVCGTETTTAHHCFLTAVHAAHLPTGQLLMYHGEQDERLWDIGSPAEEMTWHPAGPVTTWDRRVTSTETRQSLQDLYDEFCQTGDPWCIAQVTGLPEIFCSGHTQLANGELFVAGGNVTGRPIGGGLRDSWRFDPTSLGAMNPPTPPVGGCNFGWDVDWDGNDWVNPEPKMTYDRWYPTLTTLGDGRVLIAGGTSLQAAREDCGDTSATCHDGLAIQPPMLEIYNPTGVRIGITEPGEMVTITSAPSPFEDADGIRGIPNYPFMFQLPNGDILYAGSENAVGTEQNGHILIPETQSPTGEWMWSDHIINSTIPGGSAVMYEPGKVLKTGGGNDPDPVAEWIDLSQYPSGNYDAAPTSFTSANADESQGPEFARHFHNLVLLPDGRVVSIGGNNNGNGAGGDLHSNPCEVNGQAITEYGCGNCPSVCVNMNPAVREDCSPEPPENWGCSLLRGAECECATSNVDECNGRPNCTWTGDAMTGSCDPDQAPDDFCDELLPGAECRGGRCEKSCADANGNPDDSMCGPTGVVGGQCVLPDTDAFCQEETNEAECNEVPECGWVGDATNGTCVPGCMPQNNGCYATKALEMWDPSCQEWTTLGAQARPRMYHSTALLIPDGRVISMGSGHSDFAWLQVPEEPNAEYFEPTYTNAPGADRPEVSAPDEMLYNSSIEVTVDIPVSRATLVRLGSTTHGFDMSQRFIELPPPVGEGGSYMVMAPADEELDGGWTHRAENIAPPGHYMLFLFSDDGMPSVGHYIKLRGPALQELNCEITTELQANETSCSQEPVGGVCPAGAEVQQQLSFPTVQLGTKSFSGFQVYASSNVMHDIANPRPQELEAVQELCASACIAHFADVPGASANCAAAGGFHTPEGHAEGEPSLNLIAAKDRDGTSVFPGAWIGCNLDSSCAKEFDEALTRTAPERVTPAGQPLGYGTERVIALGQGSTLALQTNLGQYEAALRGQVGYSECTNTDGVSDCPFYLGELEAASSRSMTISAKCKDGTEDRLTLDNLIIALSQPAFGVAEGGTNAVGFPSGALVVDTAFDIGRDHARVRRPNRQPVILSAGGGTFSASGLTVGFELPCNQSTADIAATLNLVDPGDGSQLAHAPLVDILIPDTVTCGSDVQLAAAVTDRDDDLVSTRWLVDGVLMQEGIGSMSFTEPHELELVAQDARGAATTARKVVQCN